MDGAADGVSIDNVRALVRYRARREQQACRVMQADAAACDSARNARDAAAAVLASAEHDRSAGEQQFYRGFARTANVTIEMLHRQHDALARLSEVVQGARRLTEAAEAVLANSEAELCRSTALYRTRHREARKAQAMGEKLAHVSRCRAELIEELNIDEQNTNQSSSRQRQESWPR